MQNTQTVFWLLQMTSLETQDFAKVQTAAEKSGKRQMGVKPSAWPNQTLCVGIERDKMWLSTNSTLKQSINLNTQGRAVYGSKGSMASLRKMAKPNVLQFVFGYFEL